MRSGWYLKVIKSRSQGHSCVPERVKVKNADKGH